MVDRGTGDRPVGEGVRRTGPRVPGKGGGALHAGREVGTSASARWEQSPPQPCPELEAGCAGLEGGEARPPTSVVPWL